MGDDGVVAMRQDAGVETALGHDEIPYRLAGLRFHGQGGAVGPAGDQQAHAVDGDDVHGGVAGVIGPPARRADPHDVAGLLVESDHALRAVSLSAPSGSGRGHDHEVAVDDGRRRASAVRGERGELFGD